MKKLVLAALASMGLLSSMARAQALRPIGSAPVSPYLNLVRPGINPAINYYGSVRPQLTYNAAINSLEQQVQASKVAMTAAETAAVPQTGHPIQFLNYRQYFLNTGVTSPFQNVQGSARAIGAGSLPVGSAAGVPGTRSSFGYGTGYGVGAVPSIGALGAAALRP